jgi:hypothetical protein
MTEDEVQGSGLAGFLAHALWKLYRHFPLEGSWDWLLLFLSLGMITQLSFMPYLWRCVEADIKMLRDRRGGEESAPIQGGVPGLFRGGGWMFFFLWFFATTEGQTCLNRRFLFGGMALGASDGHHQIVSGLIVFGLLILLTALPEHFGNTAKVTAPFRDRGFWSLWQGGGTFEANKGSTVEGVTFFLGLLLLFAHLLYWYWSEASLALMQCFLAAALMADALRVVFVYVLHKRYFG